MKAHARTPLALAALAVAAILATAPLAPAVADTVSYALPVIAPPAIIDASPDGSKVVLLSVTSAVSVLDVASGIESTPVSLGAVSAYNLVVSPTGATALVPTTDGDLWFVNLATGAVTGPVHFDNYLFDVAFSADGTLAYVTTSVNSIVIVDVASRTEVGRLTLSLGTAAYGIALAPDGATLFVTDLSASTLLRVDVATGVTTGTFATLPSPTEVVVRADGGAYIASFVASTVASVDPAGNYLAIPLSGSGPITAITLSPDNGRLYVPRGFGNQVAIVDTTTNTEIAPLVTGVDSRAIAFTADGTTALVGDAGTPAVLVIAVDRPPVLAGAAPAAVFGVLYSFTVGTGGSPSPTFALTTGALPAGLTLDLASGVISGTPIVPGTSSFSITSTNGSGTATQAYTLTVAAALAATGVSPAPLLGGALALLGLGLALIGMQRRARHWIQETSGVR